MWPRWLRMGSGLWVALDSAKNRNFNFFWVLTILFLGPLLLPLYIAFRPPLKGERKSRCFLWNLLTASEKVFSGFFVMAAISASMKNFLLKNKGEHPNVTSKRKAATLFGLLTISFFLLVEKIFFFSVRKHVEKNILKF
ncbi:MAG: hypothetical protein GX221_03590 [Candidatus Riflebacteria bacterium]|nr:hypothetical protein [Candidatus Riflebacteria bacterium]